MSVTEHRMSPGHRSSFYTTTQANMLPSKYFRTIIYYVCRIGRYLPSYPKKYNGDSKNIIYRSLWERKFMNYCDLNEAVKEWQSEEFWIPYISPVDKEYIDIILTSLLSTLIRLVNCGQWLLRLNLRSR